MISVGGMKTKMKQSNIQETHTEQRNFLGKIFLKKNNAQFLQVTGAWWREYMGLKRVKSEKRPGSFVSKIEVLSLKISGAGDKVEEYQEVTGIYRNSGEYLEGDQK